MLPYTRAGGILGNPQCEWTFEHSYSCFSTSRLVYQECDSRRKQISRDTIVREPIASHIFF